MTAATMDRDFYVAIHKKTLEALDKGDKMHINFELTEQDYIDFNIYHLRTSRTMKRSVLLLQIIGPLVFLAATFFAHKITGFPFQYWAAVFLISSVLWFAFYPRWLEKDMKKKILKMLSEGENKSFLGRQEINLGENELVSRNGYESKSIQWSAFNKVKMTENHIFIYNSSISAFIVPVAAFESHDAMLEFYDLLNQRISKKV